MSEFRVIRISADSPIERGMQYGKQAKDSIALCRDFYMERFKTSRHMSWKRVRDIAMNHLPYIEREMPDILEEVKGIAIGSEMDLEDIMVLNCRYEILHFPQSEEEMECTAFALMRNATADGHVIIGQNWDMRPDLLKHSIILDITEEESRNHIIGLTEAGQVIRNGINSIGIAQCSNSLHSKEDAVGYGVPSNFVRRKILAMQKISDVIDFVHRAKRSVSVNYCIGSSENQVIDIEAVPEHCMDMHPTDGVLAHANNIVVDTSFDTYKDERFRGDRLYELLSEKRGDITVEYIMQCLKNHEQYPDGICNHTVEAGKPWQTIASVIYDLDAKKAWICYGPPCLGEYKEYSL